MNRSKEIKEARLEEWTLSNLTKLTGDIPGTLMRAAAEGEITVCLNFDSEHVDLEVARKVVELVGSKHLIAMTDRIDQEYMCGNPMQKKEGNNLWYQSKGVVSAGSYTIDRLIHNLRTIGCNETAIWDMVSFVPLAASGRKNELFNHTLRKFSYVSETKQRHHFDSIKPSLQLV